MAAARRYGAHAVAHGCTGKGNDQVRFEVGTRALAPDLEILAPARMWGMSREECVAYAHRHGIPVEASKEKIYSIDENLWGRAIECGEMEDPWNRPPDDAYVLDAADGDRAYRDGDRFRIRRAGLCRRKVARPRRAHRRGRGGRRLLRMGPHRHGREPQGWDKEPRDLRVPCSDGAIARAPRPRGRDPRTRCRPREAPSRDQVGRARLRRDVVLTSQRGAGRVLLLHPAERDRRGPACSRAGTGHRFGRPAAGQLHRERQAEPLVALRVRPRHIRLGRQVPPPGRRGLREVVGTRDTDLVGPTGLAR